MPEGGVDELTETEFEAQLLKAELQRLQEEPNILENPPLSLPGTLNEVGVNPRPSP